VRVISAETASMRLELLPHGGEPVMLTMEGQYFAPIVKVVVFNDLFVFLGAKNLVPLRGDDLLQAEPAPGGLPTSVFPGLRACPRSCGLFSRRTRPGSLG